MRGAGRGCCVAGLGSELFTLRFLFTLCCPLAFPDLCRPKTQCAMNPQQRADRRPHPHPRTPMPLTTISAPSHMRDVLGPTKLPRLSGIYGCHAPSLSFHSLSAASTALPSANAVSPLPPPEVSPDVASWRTNSMATGSSAFFVSSGTPAMNVHELDDIHVDFSRPVSPICLLGQASDE